MEQTVAEPAIKVPAIVEPAAVFETAAILLLANEPAMKEVSRNTLVYNQGNMAQGNKQDICLVYNN